MVNDTAPRVSSTIPPWITNRAIILLGTTLVGETSTSLAQSWSSTATYPRPPLASSTQAFRGVNSPCTATHGTRQLGTSPKSRRSCQHLKYVWPLYYCHMDQALECEMVIYGGTWTTLSRVIVLKPLKAWQVNLRRQHGSPLRDPGGHLVVSCGLSDQKKPKKDRL